MRFAALIIAALPLLAQENGIYATAKDGRIVTAQDGTQLHLGDRRSFQIRESVFMPQNNENSSFQLWIGVPDNPGLKGASHVLVVDSVAYGQRGMGSKEGGLALLVFSIQGAENAGRAAAYLGTSANFRRRPEHRLQVVFTPSKPVFQLGSDVQVKMRLTNAGDQPVAFMVNGGTSHSGDPYAFTARLLGDEIKSLRRSVCVDCFDGAHVLKPGDVFEGEVNLSQWYSFQKRGTYQIRGSHFLDLRPTVNALRYTLWEEYISADFQVVIE